MHWFYSQEQRGCEHKKSINYFVEALRMEYSYILIFYVVLVFMRNGLTL